MKKPKVEDMTMATGVYLQSLKFLCCPFPFLPSVGWLLIILCFCFTGIACWQRRSLSLWIPAPSILSVTMALFPTDKPRFYRVSYVAIESALIFSGAILGNLPLLSVLYIIVIIQGCFLFNPLGRWAIAGLSFLLFLVAQMYAMQSISRILEPYPQQLLLTHAVAEIGIFGLTVILTVQLASALLAQTKIENQLALAHQQLQQYALQTEILISVKNRNRMAHTVYYALGHALAAQNIQLQTAVKLWQHDPNKAKPFLDQAQQLTVEAIQEIRRAVRAFRISIQEEQAIERIVLNDLSQERDTTLT